MPKYDDPIWAIVALSVLLLAGVVDYIRGNQQGRARNTPNAAKPEEDERSPAPVEGLPHKEDSSYYSDDRYDHDRFIRRWTALLGTAAAVVAAILAAFTLKSIQGQLEVMRGQLKEMQDAGADTKKAIEATNRLATEAGRQADETKRQADLTQQNMLSAHRPWVDFADGPQIDEPLNFFGSNGASLSVKTSARNTGNSPAIDVAFENTTYFEQ
jgi:hypothetical protein